MELTTLPPEARAAIAMESTATEQYLTGLATAHAGITEAKDKAGRDQAHRAAMQLMQARMAVEKTADDAKADAKRFVAGINSECARLVAIVKQEEVRLKGVRDEWDSEQARIKEAEAEAKRKRIEALNQRIAAIRDIGSRAMRCATSEQAQAIASELDAVDFEGMDEFEADAQYAHGEATETCAAVIERLQAAEQTARELEQQRAELAAAKAEAGAARAELARIRAEEQAKAEREASELVEAERRAEAARQHAEAERQKAQNERKRIEFDRVWNDQHANLAEAEAEAAARQWVERVIEAPVEEDPKEKAKEALHKWVEIASAAKAEADNTPAATAQATGPMLKLGEINACIAPISITVDGLAQLGFTPAATDKASRLYRAADLPLILAAMVRYLNGVGVDLLQVD